MTGTAGIHGPSGAPRCWRVGPEQGTPLEGSPHLFKAAASETGGRFDFMVGTFAPMTGPPLHLHREQDDSFYVLDGVLTVQVGDEIFDIGPGEFLTVPPGVPHAFENLHNGGRPVRAVNLITPGGHLDMFSEMARAPDEAATNDVAARHGTEILGPPIRAASA